jgi:hypothetical protein
MAVIAGQLGHADTGMTEKHYARLASSYVAQTIRKTFPVLAIGKAQTSSFERLIAQAIDHTHKGTAD